MTLDAAPPAAHDMRAFAARHGLKPDEYDRAKELIGREPNETEVALFTAMWSEHCSYKSSKTQLRKFPTTGPRVIHGPGENAGVVDIGDGLVAVFKMESHNHPSFIEPYQGAATGVGGILRDVFTMGARPVANLNALRFGSWDNPNTPRLLAGVVAGIGGYGNCVGVPTVGGETNFHRGYDANILVNAMTVGIAERDKIFTSVPERAGDLLVYVGSKTGRDGVHGASMASAEFDEEAEAKRPTVQVGDPFAEKLLLEACLELMAAGAVVAIQDMGAAGLTSSSVEMASKGGLGVELNLDHVPMREDGMSAFEIMLSESQERMLMVLSPGREADAEAVFTKWGLDAAVIGVLTDTNRIVLKRLGAIVADLPLSALADDAPVYDRSAKPTAKKHAPGPEELPTDKLLEALTTLMASPDLCARRWITEQYDSHVMADTLVGPGGDAALVRVHGTRKALALSTDVTPRYCLADPVQGGRQAVAEACRNLASVGAIPIGLTDCLNFGNPEKPEIMGQIAGCIDGMAEACRALDAPIVSGNVSLYNETNGVAITPTPTVGAVGLVEDYAHTARIDAAKDGDLLIALGACEGWLGQSLYRRELFDREDGAPPPVDLLDERRLHDLLRVLIREHGVRCAHDVSDGGLLVAAAEMALAANVGLAFEPGPKALPAHAFWFGEDQGRALIAISESLAERVVQAAMDADVPCATIGRFGGDALILRAETLPLAHLRARHEEALPRYMGDID